MILPIFASAFLFYLAFPNIFFLKGYSFLAWVFAVPFFFVLEKKDFPKRLLAGFLFGVLANLSVVNWMIPYSFAGYLLLGIALSSQAVIFAALYPSRRFKHFLKILYVPSAWVVSEFLRKMLMFGQSWDLGHSQSFDINLLQIAGFLGSSGISFLLVCVNYVLYCVVFRVERNIVKIAIFSAVLFFLASVYALGMFVYCHKKQTPDTVFKVCVIQPNINYLGEISARRAEDIVKDIISLTSQALLGAKPDLVLWPETAVAADLFDEVVLQKEISAFVRKSKVAFLIGSTVSDNEGRHNSAVYFDESGQVAQIYHKRHLIPLTEYIPRTIFWETFARIFRVESPGLAPGTASGLMHIISKANGQKAGFGVVICSEDNVAEIFRQYIQDGADFIIVLLNNGWFSQKAGLLMHAQHSIIHAVENRVPVVRASNTGFSGVIDPSGALSSDPGIFLQQRKFFIWEVGILKSKNQNQNLVNTFCLLCLSFVIILQLFYGVSWQQKGKS